MSRRVLQVALAGVVSASVSAIAPPVGADEHRSAIQELLRRRAAAVRAGDRAAFMGTIDPGAQAFRKRQRRLFDGMLQVPLRTYRLQADWDRYGDLARRRDRAKYEADAVALPVTIERYRVRGFDEADAVEELFYTYVKRGDRWLIAADDDLDAVGMKSARHLWDFGAVQVDRSRHFMSLRHTCGSRIGCVRVSPDLLRSTEDALARVRRYWPAPWSRKVLMLAPSSTDELARMIQATFPLDNFVAFAYSSEDHSDGVDYTGHRIMLNPSSFLGRTGEGELNILAHELLHIASRELSGPFLPFALEEGIAEYVGGAGEPRGQDYLASQLAGGAVEGRLPRDHDFLLGSGDDIYLSYVESGSAVEYLVDRYGIDALVRLYRRAGRPDLVAGTTRYHLDRAFREATGSGFSSFERAWADSIGA